MAKLVTKFKYLKPDTPLHAGGYAKYIATREGVEKIDDSYKLKPATQKQQQLIKKILRDFPDTENMLEYQDFLKEPNGGNASEFITRAVEDNADEMAGTKTYADYIATRPGAERYGAHGLFTREGETVELSKVSAELNQHDGNVWTIIISLRREDAERLGFNNGIRWRDMLRNQESTIASALGIPMTAMKWYGAFHNESYHPHIHMLVYSPRPNVGHLNKQGVHKLRASFAKDIFQDELNHSYRLQMEYRDALRQESREQIAKIVAQINSGTYDNPALEEKLLTLADRLSKTSGKKVYGYLKADVKGIVDSVVDELAADERIAELYRLWNEQREEILSTYTDEMPQQVPLTDNKEFKPIKNAVIQEAMNIVAGKEPVEEPDQQEEDVPAAPVETVADSSSEEAPQPEVGTDGRTWWNGEYRWARAYLYGNAITEADSEQAFRLMKKEAKRGNGFAMFDFGKMYLTGLGCEANEETAARWFASSLRAMQIAAENARDPCYLQYRIGKMYALGYGTEQDYKAAAMWYEKSIADNNPLAAYSLGCLYHRGQGVERNEKRAYTLFEMAAEDRNKPNAYAAYELGRMCEEGIGTIRDEGMADYWYSAAYDGFVAMERNQADDKLYYRLGQMNLTGSGTTENTDLARDYFEKAAKLGNVDALFGLGKLYLSKTFSGYDPRTAVEYLASAARKGHDFAQYTLGRLFLQGIEVRKNPDYAVTWLEEAVKNENTYAQYLLGRVLLMGEDVPQDRDRGTDLIRKAADSGNTTAAYTMGKLLLEGMWISQDIRTGMEYMTKAAEDHFSAAQYYLGKVLYEGKLVPKDTPKAVAWLERSAQSGNTYGAYLAGKILLTDETVKDPARAVRNFELAAQYGNDYAEYQLGNLYLSGKDIPQDYEKAFAYLNAAASHGNQYAAQMLKSIHDNRNWNAAVGSIRLLHHMSRMLKNQAEEDRKELANVMTDRKLRRQIEEKKQAQGLKT